MDKIQEIFDNFSTEGFMQFIADLLNAIFETLSKIYGWSDKEEA